MLIEGINMIFEIETHHVKLRIYPSKSEKHIYIVAFIDIEEET